MTTPTSETLTQRRRILLLAPRRYATNVDDLWMFFSRSEHEVVGILEERSLRWTRWWRANRYLSIDGAAHGARDHLWDPIDFSDTRTQTYSNERTLRSRLDAIEFDYLAMGNGSGELQQAAVDHVGRERCLFTEYGWLPWPANFYISRDGCGMRSEIASIDADALGQVERRPSELSTLRDSFAYGRQPNLEPGRFIYVPLQKDVDDFKFDFCRFDSNVEFIDFLTSVVPPDYTIAIKQHPLFVRTLPLERWERVVEITADDLDKAWIYRSMAAMACINSTSILEAILFGGTVFAFGEDLFLNKGLVHFDVRGADDFAARLHRRPDRERCDRFLSLLLERQITRRRCIENDRDYIARHYWNRQLT